MLLHEVKPVVVTGTLPLRPFTDQFAGTIAVDGSTARVSALACDGTGAVVLLSLVGSDTTCGAAFASLGKDKLLPFTPAADVSWTGPRQLRRPGSGMRLHKGVLTGTYRQAYRHVIGLANNANIAYGLAHPHALPEPAGEAVPPASSAARPAEPQPCYLLGNRDEGVPHPLAFLGHLRALRIVFLPQWVDALWEQSIVEGLVTTNPALGVCAWRITDRRERWGALIKSGVLHGWLPGTSAPTVLPLSRAA